MDLTKLSEEAFRRHIMTRSATEIRHILDDWRENCSSEPLRIFARPIAEDLAARPRGAATAACLFTLGLGMADLGMFGSAMASYEQAQAIFSRLDQGVEAASCLMNRAISLVGLSRYREALAGFDEARAVFTQSDQQIRLGGCLMDRAVALRNLGRYEEALTGFDEAQRIAARFDRQTEVARCLMSRGIALRYLGRSEDALAAFEQAQAVFARLKRPLSVARCLLNRAVVLQDLGRDSEALAGYDEAQRIFASVHRPLSVARCLVDRGVVMRSQGKFAEAMADYEQAQAVFARFDRDVEVASCLMNRAAVLRDLGRLGEALDGYEQAQTIFAHFDRLDSLVRCLLGLSRTQEACGDLNGVRTSLLAACEALERALSRVGTREEDIAGFREGLPDPFLPAVGLLLEEGSCAQTEGRESDAAARQEQAFMVAERSRSARLRAELSCRFATEEPIESEDVDPDLFARWQALQHELTELDARLRADCGRSSCRVSDSESAAQRGDRDRILQSSESVERELYLRNSEMAGLVSPELPELEELRRELAADEGIVAYLMDVDGGKLLTFCVDDSGLHAATMTADPALGIALASLDACIAICEYDGYPAPGKGGEEADWQAVLTSLGDRLLAAPAALGWLSGAKRRLTFVPSGALFSLPFAALSLPDVRPYRPLITDVEVAIAPQAFTRLYQRGKGDCARGAVAILNPDGSLSSSAHEAALLAENIDGILVYRGDAPGSHPPLTAETVPKLIDGRRIVHFTCHGRYEQAAPWQSKLIFAGATGAPESHLTALQIYGRLSSTCGLIFASACESAKGTVLAGDAFIGLHRALLFHAREVVAPLFKVRDDATADLERFFYRAYAEGSDAVAALATAQRAFLVSESGRGEPVGGYLPPSHPYWWAGLVVLG